MLFRSATASSTFGLDFSETFYRYPGDLHQNRYQALMRYNAQLSYALAWYVEGGYSFQDVVGAEQNMGAARTGLNWLWGKLNFRAGYQYNEQITVTGATREDRNRNFFFAYLRRSF